MEAEAEAAESDIDMSKLQLGVASACVISGFCSGSTTLVSLNVGFNKIGAEGATILAQGVEVRQAEKPEPQYRVEPYSARRLVRIANSRHRRR